MVGNLGLFNSSDGNDGVFKFRWKEECTVICMEDNHLMVLHCVKKSDSLCEVAYVISHFMAMY